MGDHMHITYTLMPQNWEKINEISILVGWILQFKCFLTLWIPKNVAKLISYPDFYQTNEIILTFQMGVFFLVVVAHKLMQRSTALGLPVSYPQIVYQYEKNIVSAY